MKDTCYLVFDETGVKRMNKNPPAISGGEYYLAVNVNIPNSYFTNPILQVSFTLPERDFNDAQIKAQIKENIMEVGHFAHPHVKITFQPETAVVKEGELKETTNKK